MTESSRDSQDESAAPKPAPHRPLPTDEVGSASAQRSLRGPAIAVLPFANLSGDPSQEYLSDGFTEDIINGLSYFSELSVIVRNSSFAYKGRAVDARAVGQELGVGYLVEGSVRRYGDQLRVAAQLVDARSGIRRWAERFDRTVGDVFAIQDEIAHAIVRITVAHLGHAERERVRQSPPTSWTAYDLSSRADAAQRADSASWALDKFDETRRLYAEARKADPDNASICAKLSFVSTVHRTWPGTELTREEVDFGSAAGPKWSRLFRGRGHDPARTHGSSGCRRHRRGGGYGRVGFAKQTRSAARQIWLSLRARLAAYRGRRLAAVLYAQLSKLSDADLHRRGIARCDLHRMATDTAESQLPKREGVGDCVEGSCINIADQLPNDSQSLKLG